MYGHDDEIIPGWLCLIMLLILVIGMPLACNKFESDRKLVCGETTIISIGACNEHGTCGVKLSDGTITTMVYPIVGEKCK